MKRSLALVGFMGSGKTTAGRIVADRLQIPFHDSDHEIEAATGRSAAEWILEAGESAWRAQEECWLRETLTGGPAVLALGGGAFTGYGVRRLLSEGTTTIWLDLPLQQLSDRLEGSETRPLWPNSSGGRRQLFARRCALYRLAEHRLPLTAETPEQAATLILKTFRP